MERQGQRNGGGNLIEDRLQESYRSRGIRVSTEARWLWKGHQKKFKSWIVKERIRSHTVGIDDVRDEWIDMADEEIQELNHQGVMSEAEILWVGQLQKQILSNIKIKEPQRRV